MRKLILGAAAFLCCCPASAQLVVTDADSTYSISFDSTFVGVNNGQFQGAGYSPAPVAGQLNSNAWKLAGMSDGDLPFGGIGTGGDYARGTSSGGVGTGGAYAFEVAPGDYALGVQPTGSDFAPGSHVLRVVNQSGVHWDSIGISYEIHVFNDQERSSSFNFSHSTDDVVYTDVLLLDYITAQAADASPAWTVAPRSAALPVQVHQGDTLYLRWTGDDVGGSGMRDELALDDIVVEPSAAAPPQVEVKDIFPQIAAGSVLQGASGHVLQQVKVFSTNAQPLGITRADFASFGNYDADDVAEFALYHSSDSVLDGSDLRVGQIFAPAGAGNHSFGSVSANIGSADTGYFFITADVDLKADAGHSIGALGISFSYSTSATETNSSTAGGLQIVRDGIPAWINEIHYDNAGSDEAEGVEIVVVDTGAFPLEDFSLYLYNGNNGGTYETADPHAYDRISDTTGSYVFAACFISGIQNGAPDGLVLVYQDTVVVQFLSYEGVFTATDGPASGMSSEDIAVGQQSDPNGTSLQLVGAGSHYKDFVWKAAVDTTWGAINEGQYFGDSIHYIYNNGWGPIDPVGTSTLADTLSVLGGTAQLPGTSFFAEAYVAPGAVLNVTGDSLVVADRLVLDAEAVNDTGRYAQLMGRVSGTTQWHSILNSDVPARWFNLAVPLEDATLGDVQLSDGMIWTLADAPNDNVNDTAQTNIWWYDTDSLSAATGQGLWRPVADAGQLADNKAWSLYMGAPYFGSLPVELSVEGRAKNGNYSYPLSNANGGFNFVPNPYPSSIDWNEVTGDNATLGTTYYIFNEDSDSSYVGYNSEAGEVPDTVESVNQYIAPGQAFFVSAESANSIIFQNSQRTLAAAPRLYRRQMADGVYLTAITSIGKADFTYVGFKGGYNDGYNSRVDGKKMRNWGKFSPNIAVNLQGVPYMYKFLDEHFTRRSLPVHFDLDRNESVRVQADFRNIDPLWTVELEDKLTGSIIDLRTSDYSFWHSTANAPGRFVLHFHRHLSGSPEDVPENEVLVYTDTEGKLYIDLRGYVGADPKVELCDLNGRVLMEAVAQAGALTETDMRNLPQGIYILKVSTRNELLHTQKISHL